MQRGQDISKRDWRVLRVAIVELRNETYIGRLFFGDADSGNVVWDCDCRPSDGCWLALKVDIPLNCSFFFLRHCLQNHLLESSALTSMEEPAPL